MSWSEAALLIKSIFNRISPLAGGIVQKRLIDASCLD